MAKRLWTRPGLSKRDRSIATLAVAVARNQSAILPEQVALALDHGVKPAEISEIITHLAFYSGWGNSLAAIAVAKGIFAERGMAAPALPPSKPELLAIDEAAEAKRVASVEESIGATTPGLVKDTTAVLFRDLWLRPGLAPRDRSLVTVSTLIANGQTAQIPPHLNRALDNGLTPDEAGEVISHLAYYAGRMHSPRLPLPRKLSRSGQRNRLSRRSCRRCRCRNAGGLRERSPCSPSEGILIM
jgi:4-carboxymuconolactone decarboxylase